MADQRIALDEDFFTCPVCLDPLSNPFSFSCGHNFCMKCIDQNCDQEDQRGFYFCPLCQQSFPARYALNKNPLISDTAENQKTARQTNTASHTVFAGSGDVECNEKALKAVKSCLDCLMSYCETHFKEHNEINLGREHLVANASFQFKERICIQHRKVLEIFCHTDQTFICHLCMLDEHKGHNAIKTAAMRSNIQVLLGETQRRFQQKVKERENELQELKKAVDNLKTISTIADLPRIAGEPIEIPSISLEALKESICDLKVQLEEKLKEIFKEEEIEIPAGDPCHFTLDPNTANPLLHLSEGNRTVEWKRGHQSYPDHQERFDRWCWQVLCREGVCGRCYFEVEWSGQVAIAVAYKSISRKGGGDECVFGRNNQSWMLELTSSGSSFWHNSKETKLPLVAKPRIGVHVDHKAGILAFYNISQKVTLLLKVHTMFTHKIFPGFGPNWGLDSSVKLL